MPADIPPRFARRHVLRGLGLMGLGLGAGLAMPVGAKSHHKPAKVAKPKKGLVMPVNPAFPAGFLWGAAYGGHHDEGGDTNSDLWALEHARPSAFPESAGDAANGWALWEQDLDLARAMGLNALRIMVEWSRVEPDEGRFSQAALDHYRAVAQGARARGMEPVITLCQGSAPRWFALRGGWADGGAGGLFARYAARVAGQMGALVARYVTLGAANGFAVAQVVGPRVDAARRKAMVDAVAGGGRFVSLGAVLPDDMSAVTRGILAAHRDAVRAIKVVRAGAMVGLSIIMFDDVASEPSAVAQGSRALMYGPWLEAARGDDFLGIEGGARLVWSSKGRVEAKGRWQDDTAAQLWPEALAAAADYAHQASGCPILITGHGMATRDDARRVLLITETMIALKRAMDKGLPVLGYTHWALVDGFEGLGGSGLNYGLHAVDPTTFVRHTRPSALVLGGMAKRNSL